VAKSTDKSFRWILISRTPSKNSSELLIRIQCHDVLIGRWKIHRPILLINFIYLLQWNPKAIQINSGPRFPFLAARSSFSMENWQRWRDRNGGKWPRKVMTSPGDACDATRKQNQTQPKYQRREVGLVQWVTRTIASYYEYNFNSTAATAAATTKTESEKRLPY